MSSLLVFVLIWGVWLITPVLIDGIDTVTRLATVWLHGRKEGRSRRVDDNELPRVSIIVPAHNEAAVIDRCLTSVKNQEYPHDRLEIIVVDDGSTDDTVERVESHVSDAATPAGNGSVRVRGRAIRVGPFAGTLALIKNGHNGKAYALNCGIEAASGEILVNIDSDVVLEPRAIRNIAARFVREPELGALTGNVEIDWELVEERDRNGALVLDDDGHAKPADLSMMQKFLAKSQFLEYLASFDLGRRSQAITSTMYTLAGACSAFRRELLTDACRYNNTTVSEDTCLTFDLHRRDVHVGFAQDAHVFLEPVTDWDALYAQRARWTRGQLEVCGLNDEIIGTERGRRFGRITVPKMLLFDHTMAFPRLIWAPLLLMFPFIGYSWGTIATALIAMYVFYVAMEVINTLSVFSIAHPHTKTRIEQCGWTVLFLPLYRFIVFHFRFSGFLVTLMEEQQWTLPGPMKQTRDGMRSLGVRSIEFASAFLGTLGVMFVRIAKLATTVFAPLISIVILVGHLISTNRRAG